MLFLHCRFHIQRWLPPWQSFSMLSKQSIVVILTLMQRHIVGIGVRYSANVTVARLIR